MEILHELFPTQPQFHQQSMISPSPQPRWSIGCTRHLLLQRVPMFFLHCKKDKLIILVHIHALTINSYLQWSLLPSYKNIPSYALFHTLVLFFYIDIALTLIIDSIHSESTSHNKNHFTHVSTMLLNTGDLANIPWHNDVIIYIYIYYLWCISNLLYSRMVCNSMDRIDWSDNLTMHEEFSISSYLMPWFPFSSSQDPIRYYKGTPVTFGLILSWFSN